MTQEHEIKCWPQWYVPQVEGDMSFDVRRNDRDYKVGDVVHQREYNPPRSGFPGNYTGRELRRKITHVLEGGVFGVKKGFCILSLGPVFWVQEG